MRVLRILAIVVVAVACAPVRALPPPASAPLPPLPVVRPAAVTQPVRTVTVPTAIPADCSVDVTGPLTDWIRSVPDGSTLAFDAAACYRVDGTLWISGRNHLVLEGNQATFRAVTDGSELGDARAIRARAMFHLADSTDITLRDIIVKGANPAAGTSEPAYQARFEAQHAYVVDSSRTVMLDHVQAYDVYGDFVYIGYRSSDVTVQDSVFSRNGRQGWTINGADVLIANNSISEVRRSTIDMEPALPTWAARNVVIRDNLVGHGRLLFFASLGAAARIENVVVSGNRLVGRPMTFKIDPPASGTRSNYRILDNTSDRVVSRPGGGAFIFHDLANVEVRGNTVPVQPGRGIHGVKIGNCRHVVVAANTFPNATAPILDVGFSRDVSQHGNRIGWPMWTPPASWVAGPTPVMPG